eukprot:COSAG05_NODE_4223_length_1615_cov_42.472296_1_plen_185_part_00
MRFGCLTWLCRTRRAARRCACMEQWRRTFPPSCGSGSGSCSCSDCGYGCCCGAVPVRCPLLYLRSATANMGQHTPTCPQRTRNVQIRWFCNKKITATQKAKRWGLASVTCLSKPRAPSGTDGVCGPLGACRGARAVAVLVSSATTPHFKRQIEPVPAPPKRRTTPKGTDQLHVSQAAAAARGSG